MSWPLVPIHVFAEVVTGGTPSTSVREYWDGGAVPWLNSGELNKGVIASADNFITEAGLENSAAQLMPVDSVLIALTGATTGTSALLKIRATANQSVTGILPSNSHNPAFLLYYLRSIRDRIVADSWGGAQKHISQAYVKQLRVPLPSLSEQRRIAEILGKADALRTKRRAAVAQLVTLTQSVFLDMFGDPATNRRRWNIRTVGDVAKVQGGLQVTGARATLPREAPYLRVANVYRDALDLREIKTMRLTDTELARTSLLKDDMLIVEGHGNPREIGRGALWDGSIDRCVHQNHIIRVRFDAEQVCPRYACTYLNSPGGRAHLLRSGKTTSGLNTINVSEVRSTPMAVPPVKLQRSFASRVDGIRKANKGQAAASDKLDSLFASLQHRAFRGEL